MHRGNPGRIFTLCLSPDVAASEKCYFSIQADSSSRGHNSISTLLPYQRLVHDIFPQDESRGYKYFFCRPEPSVTLNAMSLLQRPWGHHRLDLHSNDSCSHLSFLRSHLQFTCVIARIVSYLVITIPYACTNAYSERP